MPIRNHSQAEPPYILAIDIGTSSVRASLFDRLGRPLEGMEGRRPHEIRATPDGASETDPDGLLDLVWRCIDEVMERAQTFLGHMGGVAVCTFVGNILGVDWSSQAVTPLATYADTRADGEVAGLRVEFDEAAVHDRTGCHFHPAYLPAYFRWLAKANPALFTLASRWVTIGEYLQLKLFGQAAVSYSVASWTGLLDRHRLVWDRPLLDALPVPIERLTRLVDSNAYQRGLHAEFARRWPALSDIPWFPAVGDGAAANIGSGCVSPERVAITVGTTSAIRAVVDQPVGRIPEGLWCYRVDGGRSLPGGALSEGGSLFAWMKGTLQLGGIAQLDTVLSEMAPDAHGLTVLPFLAGERSPGWQGHARGTLHGLSLSTPPLDILRAGLEAVAYRLAIVYDLLCQILPKGPQVIASGGALLRSPAWLQIVTDVLGQPVAVSEAKEASARGAALLALEALGVLRDLKEAPDFVGKIYEPNMDPHARYRRAIERQVVLYEKLVK